MSDDGHTPKATGAPGAISVLIVSHNYGAFLKEAVQSVLGQSRQADEILIVDDCSSDQTNTVALDFERRHGKIRVLTNQKRLGVVRTYNKGVQATAGEFVVIMDADDRLSANYLEELERHLVSSKREFAYAGEVFFGAISGVRPVYPWNPNALAVRNYVNTPAMFERTVFETIGGFSPWFERLGHEDWEFWVRAVSHGAEGVAVGTCWLEYRRHPRGSRGDLSRLKDLVAHFLIHLRAPGVVSLGDVIRRACHRGSEDRWPILESNEVEPRPEPH
jgi:glycosyltransferase involved in cell wall biosynthesis